jgi:hypothetical protein
VEFDTGFHVRAKAGPGKHESGELQQFSQSLSKNATAASIGIPLRLGASLRLCVENGAVLIDEEL